MLLAFFLIKKPLVLLFELGLGFCANIAGGLFCSSPASWICRLPPPFQATRPSSLFLWSELLCTSLPSSIHFPPAGVGAVPGVGKE